MRKWSRGVCSFLLFALSALYADLPLTLFKIDPATRGADVANIVTMFNAAPYSDPAQYEVAIQTGLGFLTNPAFSPYAIGNFIPYVTAASAATNGTLLLVTYNPTGDSTRNQFIVIPIEKVAAVMYSAQAIKQYLITSIYPSGELPRYDIDPALRAADLEEIFDILNAWTTLTPHSLSPFYTGRNSVGIFTTLSGPFNPPIVGGFIPNVQSVVASGGYLIITYSPWESAGVTFNKTNAVMIVTAEQVIQMAYYAEPIRSPNGLGSVNPTRSRL